MNFKVNKQVFYNALTIASRAISSNSPVPILVGIKLEVEQNLLRITSSDANLSIVQTLTNEQNEELKLSVIDEGTIIIDSRYLLDIVKKIDSEEISIEIIDGTLTHFSGEKAEFRINGYRPSDYPNIDFSEPAVRFTLSYDVLNSVISGTAFAASPKETRPVLTGVNMREENGALVCTATDSFRLARKTIPLSTDNFCVTVPAKSLNEAKNIFTGSESISISLNEKKIQFRNGTIVLQSTLLEGNFPETERLIPSTFNDTMIINRRALISAIDRSSFIKTDNMTIIRMEMNAADDILVSCKSQEIGEYNESLTAISYDGYPLDISFSGNYLADALKALSSENVKLQFTEVMKPFIITNETGDDSLLQLVLPVRTYN
ncbi:MAG: DNA polymerase III subunit beta [Solobacterium sp.]|nr:DNA polymerase III subunit beta [Solobacterium sp.]